MTSPAPDGRASHRLWTTLRILNVRLRFILLMLLTGLVAARWDSISAHWERWTAHETKSASVAESVEYYCPMHPSVIRDQPGNCPICGMPLSKRLKGQGAALPEGVVGRVALTPYRLQLAGIATSEVTSPRDAAGDPGLGNRGDRGTAHRADLSEGGGPGGEGDGRLSGRPGVGGGTPGRALQPGSHRHRGGIPGRAPRRGRVRAGRLFGARHRGCGSRAPSSLGGGR